MLETQPSGERINIGIPSIINESPTFCDNLFLKTRESLSLIMKEEGFRNCVSLRMMRLGYTLEQP